MDTDYGEIERIFIQAADLRDAKEQAAFLEEACGQDRQLRTAVERLLKHDLEAGAFLEAPALALTSPIGGLHADEPGTVIDRYELIHEIGRGGFGVVYMAVQKEPVRRKVALKIIKPGMDTQEVVARFEAERQALALMDHQGIARVLDGGSTESGRPYFVMELVDGTPITEYCDACRYPTRRRLDLFVQVCQAVQHAHLKGVIHRDIKPSNVLVSKHDEAVVPKVIDFGIAKALREQLTDKSLDTHASQMMGTPLYMSPEQAQHSGQDVDTRTDVYSLGVLLYELLTGTTPFDRERLKTSGLDEIKRIIREEEPPRPSTRLSTLNAAVETVADEHHTDPRRLSHELRGELDWIVMKAMDKDRARRYQTASDFAKDVQRYLNGEAVEACPPSRVYRFRKSAGRNRSKVAALGAITLVLIAVVAFTMVLITVALRRETSLRRLAEQAQLRAEFSELAARQMAYASDIALADRAWRDGDLKQFVQLLDRHVPGDSEADLRGFEWHYLRQLPGARDSQLEARETAVYSLCRSPDGRLIATAGGDAVVRVYDLDSQETLLTIETGQAEVNGVAFSSGGERIASAGDDGSVRIWDLPTGRQLLKIEAHPGEAYHAVFALSGELLVSCGADPVIRLWDPYSGEPRGQLLGHTQAVEAIVLSPEGHILASAGSDETARTWQIDSRTSLQTLTGHDGRLSSIAFSPNGELIATGSVDKTLRLWDAATGRLLSTVEHLDGVQCAAFGPDGRWIAAGDRGGAVRVWTLEDAEGNGYLAPTGESGSASAEGLSSAAPAQDRLRLVAGPASTWQFHTGRVYSVAVLSDRGQILSAGQDGRVFLFADCSQRAEVQLEGVGSVWDCAFTADGRLVVAGSETVRLLDAAARTTAILRREGEADWRAVAVDDRGELAAAGNNRGTVCLWDVRTGTVRMARKVDGRIGAGQLAISPDGKKLAATVWQQPGDAAWTFDTAAGELLHLLPAEGCRVVAFSPDGSRLAVDCENDILVWDVAEGILRGTWRGHTSTIYAIAFSPDGRLAASGGDDRNICVRDAGTGEMRFILTGHRDCVESIAFSPDGRTLATADHGGCLKLWHLATGRELLDLATEAIPIHHVAFSPDGGRLVYRFANGIVRTLHIPGIEPPEKNSRSKAD